MTNLMKNKVDDVVVVDDGEDGAHHQHRILHAAVEGSLTSGIGQVAPQGDARVLLKHTDGTLQGGGFCHGLSQEGHVEECGALRTVGTRDERFGMSA